MILIKRNCKICGKYFERKLFRNQIKKGRGVVCSHKCSLFKKGIYSGGRVGKIDKNCLYCGISFYSYKSDNRKFCCYECKRLSMIGNKASEITKNKMSGKIGEKSRSWKGGVVEVSGYLAVKMYSQNRKSYYISQHRLIAEKILKRFLYSSEIVHHINEIKTDNRPENLYLFNSRKEHVKFHHNPYSLKSNLL